MLTHKIALLLLLLGWYFCLKVKAGELVRKY